MEAGNGVSLTALIAIYGALVSTFVLGWNVYRDLTDKGKLKVHCYIGNVVTLAGTSPVDYLVYSVTNVGRKPILVTHLGGRAKGGEYPDFIIISTQLPKMLNPGEYLLEYSPDLTVLGKNLSALYAIDSLEKKHKVNRSVVRGLVRKAEKMAGRGTR